MPLMVQNNKYLNAFKSAGAVGETNAKTLEELNIRDMMVTNRLIKMETISKINEKYFITEKFSKSRRFLNLK